MAVGGHVDMGHLLELLRESSGKHAIRLKSNISRDAILVQLPITSAVVRSACPRFDSELAAALDVEPDTRGVALEWRVQG